MIFRSAEGTQPDVLHVAYEGVRADAVEPHRTVPTALMRQGNFSEISTPSHQLPGSHAREHHSRVADLAERTPFSILSGPNRPGLAGNLQGPIPSTENVDQFIGRGDQNIGNKIRLSVRYNWHDSVNDNAAPLTTVLPTQSTTQPRVNHNTVVSYTHTLSPNLLNDFRSATRCG